MCAWIANRVDESARVLRVATVSLALSFGLTGCLQQEDLSADVLTSFEEPTPGVGASVGPAEHVTVEHHAMPAGAAANAAIEGMAPGEGGRGGSSEGGAHVAESGAGAASEKASVQVAPATEGSAAASGETVAAEPAAGVPEFHPHREMPPGYGSSLPPDPQPEEVPPPVVEEVPPGASAPGEPEKVRPAVLSPFEREFEGQKFITVSGTISYDGDRATTVDIDCFVTDTSSRAGRKLVNKVKVEGPGAYTMKVPADYGELHVTAFMDLENNGPDSRDPQGSYEHNPLEIEDKDIENVDIVLRSPAGSAQ